jgi:hypothetical protein
VHGIGHVEELNIVHWSLWEGTNFWHSRSLLFWILEDVSVCFAPCCKLHSDIPRVFSTQIAHVGSLNLLQSSAAGMRLRLHLGHGRPSPARLRYVSTFQAAVCTIVIATYCWSQDGSDVLTEPQYWRLRHMLAVAAESKGFWWWYTNARFTAFLDFAHRPEL